MVKSRTVPQGNDHLAAATSTAVESARNKSKDGKIKTHAVDEDSNIGVEQSLPSPAMDFGIFSLGRDADLENTTNISNTKLSQSKAKKTGKKKTKKKKKGDALISIVRDESKNVELKRATERGSNPSQFFEDFERDSIVEDPNLEGTTSIRSVESSTTNSKKKKEETEIFEAATTNFVTGNGDMGFNLSAFEDEEGDMDEGVNVHANHGSNTELPLFAVTFLLILGFVISVITIILLEQEILIRISILSYICIGLFLTLRSFKIARRNNDNIHTHAVDDGCDDKKFPSDCYSFVALYNPKTDADEFGFGLMVFLFQSVLFLLMILSVIIS